MIVTSSSPGTIWCWASSTTGWNKNEVSQTVRRLRIISRRSPQQHVMKGLVCAGRHVNQPDRDQAFSTTNMEAMARALLLAAPAALNLEQIIEDRNGLFAAP